MTEYDYIIVGAGTAGCVLANRLSVDPDNEALLIEAGEKKTATIKRVADVLAKAGIPNATEKQVASWYRQTTSGHGNRHMTQYYEFMMYKLHLLSLDRPAIEDMLRELPDSAPPEEL